MDEEEEEHLRFSGFTGGKLVHESLVECGVTHVFGARRPYWQPHRRPVPLSIVI